MMREVVIRLSLISLALLAARCHGQVECSQDWTGKTTVIPADLVDDGYCDCPSTGADEPGTDACSGSSTWTGVSRASSTQPVPMTFTCPQQVKLKLPLSRVNDGICDCCDGADEPDGVCKDECAVILAEERRLRQELVTKYQAGSSIREQKIAEFQTLRKEKLEEAEKLRADMFFNEKSLKQLAEAYNDAMLQWIEKRLKKNEARGETMGYVHERDANIAMADLKGMLETLRGDELARWIIYACQMAGEMADESNLKSKTCIPLRMAGLDSAVWWEPKTYEYTPIEKSDTEKNLLLAQIWDYNLKNPSNFIWHPSHLPKKTEKRRRLDEEYDDYDDYDDYHDHDYMDDEYAYDEEDDYDHDRYSKGSRDYGRNRNDNDGDSSEAKGENREQLLELIKGDPFSYTRTLFLNKSARMLEKIEEFQKKVDDATDDEEVAETPEDVEKSDREAQEKVDKEPELDFDPMALPMIKNQVKRRQEAIERGFDYAISAQVLLEKIDTSDESVDEKWFRLRTIAMSVINHGQLASIHVWQLYLSLMPELRNDVNLAEAAEAQTCVAPWATVCPPRKTTRPNSENTRFPFPPEPIFQDAVKYCDHLSSIQNAESICAADDTIPSELEDGHFGYYEISPRSQDDLITELFEGLEVVDNSPEREEILKMQEQVQKMEEDLEDVKAKIAEVEDSVGGKDGANGGFGLEGELHSIKNECFSFEAAKYVYELCMFKGAKQKEGKSHGGTHLGDWSSSKVADDSGDDVRRIWSWKKGTKCWNGPERSADAMVSCGATTRVLSADEPETCRYVFEVESPIACDEGFRAFHSL